AFDENFALCSNLMARRAAVFGSFGQLGVELVRDLNARGYEVKGWERAALDITHTDQVERAVVDFDPEVVFNSAAYNQVAALDITHTDQVERAVVDFDPEVVFNSAAYNQVDVAEREPQAAFMVNAL